MSFIAYPAYTDSGVEWLGPVPVAWRVVRTFHLGICIRTGKVDVNIQEEDGLYPFFTCSKDAKRSRQFSFDCEALLVAGNGEVGYTQYYKGKFEAYQRTYVLSDFGDMNARFLQYHYMENLVVSVKGKSIGSVIQFITLNDLRDFPVPVPSQTEQAQIARFLDHETARIDALIEEQQRLIELLKEKRHAVISHAVTKGLDPTVPMKDSGVEWLGEVPAHWGVIAIKWLSPVLRGASPRPIDDPKYFDESGEYAWVRIADVSASDGTLRETTQTLSALGASLSVKMEPGEMFLSIAGTVGKPCITEIKACIHDGFVYFPSLSIDNKLLYRIFEVGTCYGGLGKMGTQLNLNTETVGGIQIGIPPNPEIARILEFIDRQSSAFDSLIGEAAKGVELLQERRSALISAAVTGKIDVRGWQPPASTQAPKLEVSEAN